MTWDWVSFAIGAGVGAGVLFALVIIDHEIDEWKSRIARRAIDQYEREGRR